MNAIFIIAYILLFALILLDVRRLSVFLTPPKGGEIKFPVPILDANDSENICHAMRVFPKIYKNWLELTAPLQELNKVV